MTSSAQPPRHAPKVVLEATPVGHDVPAPVKELVAV